MECMVCENQEEVIHIKSLELCKVCRGQIDEMGMSNAVFYWIKREEISLVQFSMLQRELSEKELELYSRYISKGPAIDIKKTQLRIERLQQHNSVRLHFLFEN